MIDIKQLKKDIFNDIQKENEYRVKQSIRSIIDNIITQQNIINEAVKRITEYKVALKSFEAPEALSEQDIIG